MKMRKIIAVMAAVLMLLSILPMAVFAADAETIKYTISNYPAGTQYKAETHELDDYLTVHTNTRCHFTSELRIYAPNGGVNGEVVLASTREMTKVVLNAGNKTSTLTVSTSPDNSTWTQHSTLSVVSSYKDLSVSNLPAGTKYVKLVNGSGQVRIKYITVSYAADAPSACEHVWVDADCDTPKTCSVCGATEGEALGHDWEIISEEEATCTAAGSTTYECAACGEDKVETIPALPHNYVDGFCSACGEAKPLEATIDFSTKDQRTEFSTETQKWENDGLTVTNNKGSSTSNVGDYCAPARFYKSSQIIISYEDMTKLVINAPTGQYGDPWAATLDNADLTYTVESGVYTIAFATPVDSVTLTTTAQIRANSITAYGAAPSACEHDYVGVETQAPTCGAAGVITYTCSLCGDSYTEEGAPATGEHIADGYTCSVCGAILYPEADSVLTIPEANALGVAHPSNSYSESKYYVTGEIVEYYGNYATYGNVYIKDAEGNSLLIYGLYSADGSIRYDAMDVKPVIGDTITVYGAIGSFNSTAQMKSGWVTKHTAHDCAYDDNFDVDCNICGAIREVETVITNNGTSASPDVHGVAALFNIKVEGMEVDKTTAIYTNATVNGYKLISMGAIASNGTSEKDIPAVYLCDLENDSAAFAIRVINIPEGKEDVKITFTPYFVVEIDGVETTIYGEAVSASYAEKIA